MKKGLTIFLQIGVVLIGILTLIFMIKFPLTEGRAENLSLFSIYADPFIIYGYLTSIAFFIILYQIFKILGHIGQNKSFSLNLVKSLRIIKYCAIILSILIMIAGLYIKIFYIKYDDPVGFLVICIIAIFILIITAIMASILEKTSRI